MWDEGRSANHSERVSGRRRMTILYSTSKRDRVHSGAPRAVHVEVMWEETKVSTAENRLVKKRKTLEDDHTNSATCRLQCLCDSPVRFWEKRLSCSLLLSNTMLLSLLATSNHYISRFNWIGNNLSSFNKIFLLLNIHSFKVSPIKCFQSCLHD